MFTVAGLHVLPAYLYFLQHMPEAWKETPPVLLYAPLLVLGAGRVLAMAVEVSFVSLNLVGLWEGMPSVTEMSHKKLMWCSIPHAQNHIISLATDQLHVQVHTNRPLSHISYYHS